MPPNHYAIARIPFHLKHYIFDNFRENPAIIGLSIRMSGDQNLRIAYNH